MKLKKFICEVCGREYEAAGPHRSYCDDCMPAARRARFRTLQKLGVGSDPDVRHAALIALARRIIAGEDAVEQKDKKQEAKPVPCKYCGKPTKRERGYCANCVSNGYDGIHAVTGRTNGWDIAAHEKKPVRGGWRGQKCMGGCASDFRSRIDR